MGFIKGLFTLVGGVVVIGLLVVIIKFDGLNRISQVQQLDPKALPEYMKMFAKVLDTGDAARGMIRKVKVNPDVSNKDVAEALESIATERGIKPVGILPLSDEIESRTGKKRGYIKIFSYCNPMIAGDFVDYSMAFGAFLPCRIALMEDKNGDRWLYAMAMELMIEGGHTLKPEMLKKANNVRKTIYDMMDMAAEGDF
jgi:uncharacterized protein (DUF302 family)